MIPYNVQYQFSALVITPDEVESVLKCLPVGLAAGRSE